MGNLLLRGLCLLACVLLGGCLVQTETYLSEPGEQPLDERLVGAWQAQEAEEDSIGVLFIREGDDGAYAMLSLEANTDGETGTQSYKWHTTRAWTSVVAGEGYMNLDLEGDRMVIAYRILDDGDVAVGLMHTDLFRTAIEDGHLAGSVVKQTFGDRITITADARELTQFLEGNGGHALFDFGDADAQLIFTPFRLPGN